MKQLEEIVEGELFDILKYGFSNNDIHNNNGIKFILDKTGILIVLEDSDEETSYYASLIVRLNKSSDFKIRIAEEKRELDLKINSLRSFLKLTKVNINDVKSIDDLIFPHNEDIVRMVGKTQFELLHHQYIHMVDYSSVLEHRLKILNDGE